MGRWAIPILYGIGIIIVAAFVDIESLIQRMALSSNGDILLTALVIFLISLLEAWIITTFLCRAL